MSKAVTKAQEDLMGDRLLSLVASGQSIAAAGRQLEINPRRAQRLYHRELRKVYENNVALREELLGRELKTLDILQRALMPKAVQGDRHATETVLNIMDRRSKYVGLDQAAKVQVEVTRVDEAMNEIVQIIDGSMAGAEELQRADSLPEAG